VHRAYAGRALLSVAQVGREVPVVLTGGVAQVPAAVAFLSDPSTTPCSCPSGPGSPGRTAPRWSPGSPRVDFHGHLGTPSPVIGLGPVGTR
jgi:hypothetical protein